MGYGDDQIKDLELTVAKVECDAVVVGTPIDLGRIIKIPQPSVRVTYDLEEIGRPDLSDALHDFIK
jgi:predicted GTPase